MPTVVSVFGVQPLRIGGTETFARELSRQLAERGWQSVLCFESEPTAEIRDFLKLPNVRLEVVGNCTASTAASSRALAAILRTNSPDILHLHFTGFIGLYPWLAKLLSVPRIFFTDHSSRPAGYVARQAPLWKRGLVRLINYPLSTVFCVSNYGYECMTALRVLPQNRFKMIYNGVDLSRAKRDPDRAERFRKKYSIPAGDTVVLQVSWIIPEKGIPDLLETARLVVAQNPRVRFVVVGEGPYREQYMAAAHDMGLDDHIVWTGLIEDPFGEGVFEMADIVCQLSSWEEVFGWMIAESMAYGKPVIATKVGGIPELIIEGESGFLVNPGDTVSTSDRVVALMNDPSLRERMGAAGRRIVQEKFALAKNVSQLIDSYGL